MRSQYMHVKVAQTKRKLSTTDAFAKVDKALEVFVSYQQAADRRFMEAERHVKEETKKGRRREGKKIRSFC